MNFGRWILVAFVFFALFMATLVTVCVRENIGLVSKNYYADELAYQTKMDQIKNTSALSAQPKISVEGSLVKVDFAGVGLIQKGQLALLCPSDPSRDQKFEISSNKNEQVFQIRENGRGLFRAGLKWTMGDKEYYLEKMIER
jgi:hypothetical protein